MIALTDSNQLVTTPASLREEIYNWATDNKIYIQFEGTVVTYNSTIDIWAVEIKYHIWFALKWGINEKPTIIS